MVIAHVPVAGGTSFYAFCLQHPKSGCRTLRGVRRVRKRECRAARALVLSFVKKQTIPCAPFENRGVMKLETDVTGWAHSGRAAQWIVFRNRKKSEAFASLLIFIQKAYY